MRWLSRFSAVGAVEEYPGCEVVGEIFEAMVVTGGHEDKGAGRNFMTMLAVEKEAFALGDQIDFVAPVGFLRVVAAWGVEFDFQRAMCEDRHSEISGRRRAL